MTDHKSQFLTQAVIEKMNGTDVGNLIARAARLPADCFNHFGIIESKAKKFESDITINSSTSRFRGYDGKGGQYSRHKRTR